MIFHLNLINLLEKSPIRSHRDRYTYLLNRSESALQSLKQITNLSSIFTKALEYKVGSNGLLFT